MDSCGGEVVLLRREGCEINHKSVYRLYREEGLNLRTKGRHKKISAPRAQLKEMTTRLNQCWAMDFVSNQLYNGIRFRALTVIDLHSRECLAIYADIGINGEKVTTVLSGIQSERGLPERIKVDNVGTVKLSSQLWAPLTMSRCLFVE